MQMVTIKFNIILMRPGHAITWGGMEREKNKNRMLIDLQTTWWYPRELFLSNIVLITCIQMHNYVFPRQYHVVWIGKKTYKL